MHHGTLPSNATTPHSTLPQKQSSSGTSSTQQALHNLQHRPHHTGTPIRPVQPIAEVAARRLEPESNFNASNTSTSNTATEPKHQLSQSSSTEERRQAQPPQTPIPQRLKSIASPSKNSSPNMWDRHSHPQHGSGSQGPSSAALLMPEDLRIPQEKYDKTRRVLLSPSRAQLMSVTMHGIVDNANLSPLWSGYFIGVSDFCLFMGHNTGINLALGHQPILLRSESMMHVWFGGLMVLWSFLATLVIMLRSHFLPAQIMTKLVSPYPLAHQCQY